MRPRTCKIHLASKIGSLVLAALVPPRPTHPHGVTRNGRRARCQSEVSRCTCDRQIIERRRFVTGHGRFRYPLSSDPGDHVREIRTSCAQKTCCWEPYDGKFRRSFHRHSINLSKNDTRPGTRICQRQTTSATNNQTGTGYDVREILRGIGRGIPETSWRLPFSSCVSCFVMIHTSPDRWRYVPVRNAPRWRLPKPLIKFPQVGLVADGGDDNNAPGSRYS